MNAKVSIVIPFYNRIQLVLRCIESVIAQTYGNYEIILVNDGSTENIDQIISLANNSDNIKILYQVNKGPSAARNYGISVAEGEYIAFLDSDDLWKKNKLELQLNYMIKNQYLYTHTSYSRSDSGKIVNSGKSTYRYPFVGFHCRIATPTVIVHKSLLEECNFDESIKVGEDTVLWLNISNITPLFGMNVDLATVHIDKDTTASSSSLKIEAFFSINKAFRNGYFIRLIHLVYILIRRFFKTF